MTKPARKVSETTFTTTNMVWLAVRCCCTPTKIFGFLQVSAEQAERNIITRDGHRLEIRPLRQMAMHCGVEGDVAEGSAERAVYSDDRPASFWRRLPGFVEVETSPNRPKLPLDSGR